MFLRFTLPYADPYIFPLVAVLACFGLVVIYRINDELAREQAQWFVVGLLLFAATILLLRDLRVLEQYRYTIAALGLFLLFLPRVPGIGQQVNGAYLGVGIGSISFQPAEFGKIAIIIFLAAYLQRHAAGAGPGLAAVPRRHDPAAQALRAAARGLGRGDVHARVHPRPRVVADVLRRLPGAALRRHQPAVVRDDRARAVRARGVVLRLDGRPRAGARERLARSVQPAMGRARGLPDRPGAVRPGRRGVVRHRTRGVAAERAGRRRADPGAAHRPDLRGHRQRARARRGVRPAARLHAARRARLPHRDAGAATRSPSCSPRASARCSRCRCS